MQSWNCFCVFFCSYIINTSKLKNYEYIHLSRLGDESNGMYIIREILYTCVAEDLESAKGKCINFYKNNCEEYFYRECSWQFDKSKNYDYTLCLDIYLIDITNGFNCETLNRNQTEMLHAKQCNANDDYEFFFDKN